MFIKFGTFKNIYKHTLVYYDDNLHVKIISDVKQILFFNFRIF